VTGIAMTDETSDKSMEALLQESKQFRTNAMEIKTIDNILRVNERKRNELIENKTISLETRNSELAYVERLREYWLEQQAKHH
jgi:hypothetical protein